MGGHGLGVFEGAAVLQVGSDPGRPKRVVGDGGSEKSNAGEGVGQQADARQVRAISRRCASRLGST